MSVYTMEAIERPRGRRRLRKWIAGSATAALTAGTLVVAGLGAQVAHAAPDAPSVTASVPSTVVWGEDLDVSISAKSAYPAAAADGDQFNLSFGVVLDDDVAFVRSDTLGAPRVFPLSSTDRVIPGVYSQFPGACATLGLEDAPGPDNACQVPAGKQYLVFENVSDLPAGASASHTLTLRPKASEFPIGSTVDLTVTGYTSADETFIPVFPGTRSAAGGNDHTSAPGVSAASEPIKALRMTKEEETHSENEVLRGVHGGHGAIYRLTVHHTGEADLDDAVVVDYLPAGLEYLGSCGDLDDRTTNANGTQGGPEEYPGSGPLNTASVGENCLTESSVETVNLSGAEASALGLTAGVYTKVTWHIPTDTWEQGRHDDGASAAPNAQPGDLSDAGRAASTVIRYRAGVPLFENTMDFGGPAPSADSREQGANLDNNRGASTRHGHPTGDDSDAPAKSYRNAAVASGSHLGSGTSDSDTETIDAVDFRVLKSVENSTFEQAELARYTLDLATSEYTSAAVPGPGQSPYLVVDDLGDGLCPVFPAGTEVAHDPSNPLSSPGAPVPNLMLGARGSETDFHSIADWNQALADSGINTACSWDPANSAIDPGQHGITGAKIAGVGFDSVTGEFYLDLAIDPLAAADTLQVRYSARQNTTYVNEGEQGATTSGDLLSNRVELYGETTSIDALDGVTSASGAEADGVWNASDDSEATLVAGLTTMEKKVLPRELGVPAPAAIAAQGDATFEADQNGWVDKAQTPFAPGDEVWYRIKITPPSGTDVRNPKFTDFLPVGMQFSDVDADGNGIPDNIWVVPSSTAGLGSCNPTTPEAWVTTFVPALTVKNGRVLTFTLGNNCGLGGSDRFLPVKTTLEIYIKATVVGQSAFGEVDLPQNLAKYQQNNVEGDIMFLRDEAEITLAQQTGLIKGIKRNDYTASDGSQPHLGPNAFNTDIDHQPVAQGDQVTFRLDVTAPQVDTTGYVIWDALPVGITKTDIDGFDPDTGSFASATAAKVEGDPAVETVLASGWSARAYDFGDTGYPADLRDMYSDAERSVIVWTFDHANTIPGSIPATADDPEILQGLTLGYTVNIPGSGAAAAQITQQYENDASIVKYGSVSNNGGQVVAIVPEGDDSLSTAVPGAGEIPVPDTGTVDDSDVYLPGAAVVKDLVETEIKPTDSTPADSNNTTIRTGTAASRPDDAIVQGEHATFRYSVTIPAHTTVKGGKLTDDGVFRWTGTPNPTPPNERQVAYTFVPGSAVFAVADPGGQPIDGFPWTGFQQIGAPAGGERAGTLVFPTEYTNTTSTAQTFSVTIKAWVEDRDEGTPAYNPNFPNDRTLTNTARFSFTDPNSPDPANPATTTVSDTADVRYLEPSPSLVKTVTDPEDGIIGADGNATFRLTAGNANGRVALYDAVVYDCVPSGFTVPAPGFVSSAGSASVLADGCSVTGTGASSRVSVPGGTGTLIQWNVGRLNGGATATLDFTAKVSDTAGGGVSYTNRAHIIGQTLPSTLPDASTRRGDRATGAERSVELSRASLAKSVSPTSAPVGATVRYSLRTTIAANSNFYDVALTDTLPAGLSYAGNPTIAFTDWVGPQPSIDAAPQVSGQSLTWPASGNADIAFVTTVRYIDIAFDATITNSPAITIPVRNTAVFAWNKFDGASTSRETTPPATADVTILNPNVIVQKHVKLQGDDDETYAAAKTGYPDETFTYRVRLTNTGNTPAHHVSASDVVPAGVAVDTTQAAFTGATFSPNAAQIDAGGGGTITWGDLGTIGSTAPNNTLDLVYDGAFVASANLDSAASPPAAVGTGAKLDNTARVTRYESFPSGGWAYTPGGPLPGGGTVPTTGTESTAGVTPLFPHVVPTKSVTTPVAGESYGLAHVGENFSWTLTVRNQGAGTAEDISVADLLPPNWEYVGNAMISVNGGTAAPLAAPAVTPSGTQQTLLWSEAAIRTATGAPLAAGGSFVITFDAKPLPAATGTPGTGIEVNAHTNTLRVTASDTNDEYRNKNTPSYVGPDSTADAYLGEADLQLVKTGAATPITAGDSNAAAWTLTVTNNGPDTAEGSITVSDTTGPLPAGITVTGASGTGWECTVGTRAGDGSTPIECERVPAAEPLASGDSFPVISVAVSVAATQPAVTGVTNAGIVVPGDTFDPNYIGDPNDPDYEDQNNWAEAPISTTTEADLRIAKTVSTAASEINAGKSLTWNIAPFNDGPSVSRHSAAAPIEITDTIPEGVFGVADPSVAAVPGVSDGWIASSSTGAWPVKAGDTITWTYAPKNAAESWMPVGAAAAITLTGTIEASWTADDGPEDDGSITNIAMIHPGVTPDPDYTDDPSDDGYEDQNNRDGVTVAPGDDTEILVAKTRVVWNDDADEWTATTDAVQWGDPVSYLVTVTNAGPADARDVTVVDEKPAELDDYVTHESIAPADWAHAAGGTNAATAPAVTPDWDTFTLQDETLKVGAANARSFVVTYSTDPAMEPDTVIENWVEASASNADPDRDDDTTTSTGTDRVSNLSIEKRHTGTATAGETLDYTITVTNEGPSIADGEIVVTDLLPAGLSYVAGSAVVTVDGTALTDGEPDDPTAQLLSWTPVAAGDALGVARTIVITLTAAIADDVAEQTLVNHVTVDGQNDPDPSDDFDDDPTDIVTRADMTIEKSVRGTEWIAGTDVTYDLLITNAGPSAAAAQVTDTLPAGLTLVSMSGTGWDCSAVEAGEQSGACDYSANNGLHPVGTANASTITVVAHLDSGVATGTELENTVTLEWQDSRGQHDDDSEATIEVTTDADLGIVKHVIDGPEGQVVDDPAPATAGETVWYRLQVRNHGASDAVGPVTVTDELPVGVTVPAVTTTVNGWTMTPDPVTPGDPQRVAFSLAAGQVADTADEPERGLAPVIEFEARIDPAAVAGDELVNHAEVGSPTPDSNPSNNEDDATIEIVRSADLEIVKSHPSDENGQVRVDQPLDFTIQVTNHGPSVSSGFEITDTVPVGLEVTSEPGPVAGTAWEIISVDAHANGTTTVVARYAGTLGVDVETNAADPLVISTIVRAEAYGTDANHVEITEANEPDPVPENDEFDDPILVLPKVTLITTKTAVGEFKVGETGTYAITVENIGPNPDPGPITVADELPRGLSFHSSPDAGVEVDGKTVTWTLEDGLDVGEKVKLTLVVNVGQGAYPSVTNSASVSSTADLTPDSELTDSDTVEVEPADPMPRTGSSDAIAYLAILAALLMLGGGVATAVGRRRETRAVARD